MTAFIDQLPDGLKRFSEWHEGAGISRSTAYQLLKLLEIQPEQRRVAGSKKPASFLSAEQQTLLNQAVQALNNGMSLPMIADCMKTQETQSTTEGALVHAQSAELTETQSEDTSEDSPAYDPRKELNSLKELANTDWFTAAEMSCLLSKPQTAIARWSDNYEIRPELFIRKRKVNGINFYKVVTETVQDCVALSTTPIHHPGERMLAAQLPSFNCHL